MPLRPALFASVLSVVAVALAAVVLLVTGALTEDVESPPATTKEDGLAPLRAAVAGGRFATVEARWAKAPFPARVEFGLQALRQGATTALAAPLIRDLWLTPPTDGGADWRVQAVRTLYVAYARLRVDGELCRDPTAPGGRLRFLALEFAPVVRFAAGLQPSVRLALARDALAEEAITAALRGSDDFVCAGGRSGTGGIIDADLVAPRQARIRDELAAELGSGWAGQSPLPNARPRAMSPSLPASPGATRS